MNRIEFASISTLPETSENIIGPEQCVPLRQRAISLIDYARTHDQIYGSALTELRPNAEVERAAILNGENGHFEVDLRRDGSVVLFSQNIYPTEDKRNNLSRSHLCELSTTGILQVDGQGTENQPWIKATRSNSANYLIEFWNSYFDKIDELKNSQPSKNRRNSLARRIISKYF